MTHSVIAREKLRSNRRSRKYFTDRNEILEKINGVLGLPLNKTIVWSSASFHCHCVEFG